MASCRSPRFLLECEEERRALADLAFGPDPSTMAPYDSLDGREPNAATLELVDAMKSLEDAVELVGMSHVEPGTIVPNKEGPDPISLTSPELDYRVLAL